MDPVEVMRVLGNKYNAEILEATHAPKSAQELSEELDIPIATSYRRVEELNEHDLLELEGKEMSDEGRRTKVYRRRVDELSIQFGVDETEIETQERSETKNALVDVWNTLRSEGPR